MVKVCFAPDNDKVLELTFSSSVFTWEIMVSLLYVCDHSPTIFTRGKKDGEWAQVCATRFFDGLSSSGY